MKKVSLLLFVTLILLLAFAACTFNKHEHEFAAATCESPAKCSCGETEGEALGHDMTAATCTTPSTCNRCGAVDGAALGHNWRDATCTAPKTCLTCNETEGVPAAHKNDIVLEAKDPTCSETGLTAGVKCSACGTVTTEQIVIDKIAHTEVILEAKESTCDKTGLTEGKQCSVCKEILVAQQPTEKKPHTEVILEAKESTCSEKGLTEGKQCSVCKEILVAQQETDKKPHTEGTLAGYAATCTTDGLTDGVWCTVCETILEPQLPIAAAHINVIDVSGHPASCTDRGLTDGKQCTVCGVWVVEQEPILPGEAPGHDIVDAGYSKNYVMATCQAPGSYDWIVECWVCNEVVETIHVTYDSEFNPEGYELAQLEHVFTDYIYNNDATCYADGTKTAVCDLCKEFAVPVTDTLPAEGTQREHLEPTTVACGEYWSCQYEDCDYVCPDALEHQMVPATCIAYAYCNRNNGCDFVDVEAGYAACVPGEVKIEKVVAPTCLTDGSWDEATYCTVCGEECSRETKVDPQLGHNMAPATCYAPSTCTRCGHEEGDVRASHKLEMSYADGVLAYTCVTCENNTFTVDTQKFVVTGEANDKSVISMIDQNGKYAGYNVPVDGAYQFIQSETAAGRMQGQIWISAYARGLEGFSAANKGVGFYSARLNLNFNYKEGNAEDMLSVKLVESHTLNNDPNGYHWDSPQGSIQQNLFYITNVIEDGKTVQYKITGWNGMITYIDAEADSNWSGWFDLAVGIELDEENDLVTVHYYVNGEYWYSASAPLTTSADSLTSVYMNLNTYGAGHGYKYDNLAFGYTKNGEWNFDSCDHNLVKGLTTEATCTTDGYTMYTCDKAGCMFTCKGDIVEALDHKIKTVAAQASTCVVNGWNEYSYCERCGDADAAKAAALLPLVDHTPAEAVKEKIVNETCITVGSYDSVVYCSVCKTYEFSRTPVTVDEYDGHMNLQVVKGYDSTCYATGLTDGEKCEACGVTTINQTVIPKKAHTLVEYGAVPSAKPCETPNVIAGMKCSVEGCDHIEYEPYDDELAAHTEVAFGAVTSATPCNPDTPSYLAGTKCSVCDKVLAQPTVAPTAAHTYGDDRICDVCGYEDVCSHVNTTVLQAVNATCTATGLTEGLYCNDCGTTITAQTVVEKLPHTEATLAAVPATCTATGLTAGKECSVCHTVLEAQQTIAKLPHNEVAIPEVLATCTATGLTEGKECKDCGTVTLEQVETPKLGHLNDVPLAKVDPTCTTTGLTAGVKCSRCQVDTTPQEVIDALGHKWMDATCDVPKTCSVCGDTDGEPIANHTLSYKLNSNSQLVYSCANCDRQFVAETKSYYLDGTGYDGMWNHDPKNDTNFVTNNTAVSGQYLPAIEEVDGNKYYTLINDTGVQGQGQIWVPKYWNQNGVMTDFSAANNSVAILAFDINAAFDNAAGLNVCLVMGDPDGNESEGKKWYDDNTGYLNDFFKVSKPDADNVVTVTGFGGVVLKTINVANNENKFTGWFNVQVGLVFNSETDTFTAHYYIDGEYIVSRTIEMTLVGDYIRGVQFNFYTAAVGTGLMLDDIALGYTSNGAWLFDDCDHVYGDATTVAPDCTNKGYDESVCTLCGYVKHENYVNAKGHEAIADATCIDKSVCKVCGETISEALNHNIVPVYTDKLVYSCSRCDDYTVAIEDGYFNDGTGYNGFTPSIPNNKAHGYTDRDDTLPEIVDGHYEFIKDDSYAGSGQVQIWLPKSDTHDKLQGFTPENEALGIFSMKINMKLDTGNLRVILVDINDKTANGWASNNQINTLMTFNVPSNGQMRIDGWGKSNLKTVTLQDGWTGELNVMVVMKLTANGKLTAMYYINGELLYTHTAACPITTGSINALYITGNSTAAGTGYIFDDLAYGYTPYGHWTLDGKEHVVTPATACNVPEYCTCGWTGRGLDHDLTPATCTAPATCKDCGTQVGNKLAHVLSNTTYANGALTYACANCDNNFITEQTLYADGNGYSNITWIDNSDHYTGTGHQPTIVDGHYQYIQTVETNLEAARQAQIWVAPGGAQGATDVKDSTAITNLTAANNSVGFISFKVNLKFAHKNDVFVIDLVNGGVPAGQTSWYGTGGKITSNFAILPAMSGDVVTGYNVSGIAATGGGRTLLTTIPAGEDGFSGWIDVKMALILSNAGGKNTVTAVYYINGQYMNSTTRDLETVDARITRAYINLNTRVQGTGYYIDDIAFGATANGHWAFNNANGEHVMTKGDCKNPATCSCGWKSDKLSAHNWTGEATCTQSKICSKCGAEGERLAHTISATLAGTTATYSCTVCQRSFVPEVSVSGDGSSIANMGTEKTNMLTMTDGYYSVLNNSGAAAESWVWLNGTGNSVLDRLPDFSCANNSSGVLSFRINFQGSNNAQFDVRPSYGRGSSQWLDHDGDTDAWNDCTFYLMQFGKTTGDTRTITSSYGSIGTVKLGEWLDVTVRIQLHDDGTMSLEYYLNGELALSANKVAMPIASGKISGVMLQLGTAPVNAGYLLDDFVLGYSNNDHWTLDGEDHEIVSDATCVSGIMCSCGQAIGAKLGHDVNYTPVYDAATNTLIYSCERDGCGYTCEMKGYYFDGSSKNYSDSSTANTNNSIVDGYYDYTLKKNADGTQVWNGTDAYQTQMWIPGTEDKNVTALAGFNCANNAEGILSFRINVKDTMADGEPIHFIVGNPRSSAAWSDWGVNTMYMLKLTKSGSDVTVKGCVGSSGEANSTNLTTFKTNEWVEVVVKVRLYVQNSANKISYDVYVNGVYAGTKTGNYNVTNGKFEAAYIKTEKNAKNKDFLLDDFVIAYAAHNTLDGNVHDVFAPTCAPNLKCACGLKIESLAHGNLDSSVVDGNVKYACTDCGTSYTLDGSCYSDGENKNHATINAATDGVHAYITDGNQTQSYRGEFWSPRGIETSETTNGFVDFSAANNAVGFLSFDISAYHDNRMQMQLVGKMNSGAGNWDATNALATPIFNISKPTDNGNGTYTVTAFGFNSTALKTFTVTAENMFTEMTNFAMRIYFEGDNIVVDYYVDGAYKTTVSTACTLTAKTIRAIHTVCDTNVLGTTSGMYIDNFYFGYTKG